MQHFADAEARFWPNDKFDEEPRCDESANEEQDFADESAPCWFPSVQVGMPKHHPRLSQSGTRAKMQPFMADTDRLLKFPIVFES